MIDKEELEKVEVMRGDFKQLIQELSHWRNVFDTIKKKHFNFMTRFELDILNRIEIKELPPLFNDLEKLILTDLEKIFLKKER